MLRKGLPHLALGRWPTRIHRLEGLGRAIGMPELWIKRDDESAPEYGGNKVRKLEHVLAAVREAGLKRVLTFGGTGSNHALATAIHARRFGIAVDAILVPQPVTELVARSLNALSATGAEMHFAPSFALAPVMAGALYLRRALSGDRPALIPPGASSPLGTVGYVSAAFELKGQIERGECPTPEMIILPLGSGGTVAGLALGLKLAGLTTRLMAVRVVDRYVGNTYIVSALANATAALLKRSGAPLGSVKLHDRDIQVIHEQFGGAYGRPTPAGRHAVARMLEHEGITLETTYTGKTLAALMARSASLKGRTVLFWNTYNSSSTPPAQIP